jgi:molecular chaperone HtpG
VLTDPVDDFWLQAVPKFRSFDFQSVTRGAAALSEIEGGAAASEPAEPEARKSTDSLIALLKVTLADAVKDVRASERLTDSAVCLVADENDMDIHLERLLKQHKRLEAGSKRILEVNPRHALIRRLADQVSVQGAIGRIEDAAWLLLDQARIVDGEPLPDPGGFARRLASCLERGLAA